MRRLSIVLIFILILGVFSYLYFKEGTLPVNKNDSSTQIFVIRKGENITEIAKELESQHLIRNRIVFYLVVKRLGISKNIQAGDFRLSPSMNVYEIAKSLTKGTLDIWITIIEGLRKEEIAHIFAKELSFPESEFLKRAQEGYLFPDTYLIPKDATIETVISILSKNFNNKYSDEIKAQAQTQNLSQDEAVTLASMVEKEAKLNEDRQPVASVLLKRYRNDWPLQVDATVQYALAYQMEERTWWKKNLTRQDLAVDSPHNTYLNKGLPPTPISNPGLASIKAVVEADQSIPYWYYLSDSEGKMHFAETLEEHNENISKYLN